MTYNAETPVPDGCSLLDMQRWLVAALRKRQVPYTKRRAHTRWKRCLFNGWREIQVKPTYGCKDGDSI